MNEINIIESIKNIFYHIIIYLLSFGWILLFIINKIFNIDTEITNIINLTVIFIIFILGTAKELKDIEYKFRIKDKKIIEEKRKLVEQYKTHRQKLIKQYTDEKKKLEQEKVKYSSNKEYNICLKEYLSDHNYHIET